MPSRNMVNVLCLPNELLMQILNHSNPRDVRSFGKTCRRFRSFILSNKSKLPKPELKWDIAQLIFGRRITLLRCRRSASTRARKRAHEKMEKWEFTEKQFSTEFTNYFFVMVPEQLYIKCKDFDHNKEALIKKCVGPLRSSVLALEMNICSLSESALGDFFKHLSPFALHLAGRFDRSIICDQVLPLSSLYGLFIGLNHTDMDIRTRVSGLTVRKIVNNWYNRYPDIRKDLQNLPSIPNYDLRTFRIEIPDCDLDYNELFAFLKEIIRVPHCTREFIIIGNVSKTLIHYIYSNLSDLYMVGPAEWVEEGICSVEDVEWSSTLSCCCDNDHGFANHNYVMDQDLARDPAEMCETVQLDLSISVLKSEEELLPRRSLLDFWLRLKSDKINQVKRLPEAVLVATTALRKRRRTKP
uniref:F-box domain-containing protein n=1 Tax=Haemonchus contortus TaxID=6289 RepID=A0A7I4YXL0_HAECO